MEPQERQTILYFGNDWSADNRTSSHHIARWLARQHRVYYIECPGLRAPKRTGRDARKLWSKFWQFLRGVRATPEGVKVQTLLQLPFHRYALVRRFNRHFIAATIRWLMWRERVSRPIAWFVIPHLSGVVGRLGEQLSVYYCTDDYATMPAVDHDAVRAMDEELTRKADLVFVTAESLRERKLPLNPNTHFSPHGVDVERFSAAQDPATIVPGDAAAIAGPVIGFFGLIERWIDLELIDYLAERRPDWNLVLIGRVAVPPEAVPSRPNIHCIGHRKYEDLPAYGKAFDVAIIPFQLTPVILHANPLKLREYLAMGKPVVSIRTPEIEKYEDVIEIADTREEFLEKIERVLACPDSTSDVRRRTSRVAGESWEVRFGQIVEAVRRHLPAPTDTVDPGVTVGPERMPIRRPVEG
jgi:glycosyltransferase involved in cell wall biosynthesis